MDITEFQKRLGASFALKTDGPAFQLQLDQVVESPQAPTGYACFSAEFIGPAQPVLPQATYCLIGEDVMLELFLVPIERQSQGIRYQAIFNQKRDPA
ncbi:MAG: hypothetical protein H6510_10585 [Acidobacteria bacterium]|nr:hypothetical protein [Acidobacteriota bacterium]MCB9398256.1 hypothetical protein [Acidobacteriota bacterium]